MKKKAYLVVTSIKKTLALLCGNCTTASRFPMLIQIFKPEYKQQPLMAEQINSKPRDKKTHWFFLTAQSSSYIRHSPVKASQTVRKKTLPFLGTDYTNTTRAIKQDLAVCCRCSGMCWEGCLDF